MHDFPELQAANLSSSYITSITTADVSGIGMDETLKGGGWEHLIENSCADTVEPYGPLHPRTYLLMWYRRDALAALNLTSPPDHWEGLLELMELHRQAKATEEVGRATASKSTAAVAATPLPKYGLCLTVSPHCGRVGDVLAAIAASVVQIRGTAQGYVFGLDKPAPELEVLVNGTGWRYAAEMLRLLLSYNAPDNITESAPHTDAVLNKGADPGVLSPFCHAVSPYFALGSCMLTLEWDAVLPHMMASAVLRQPGALAVAPLPGSRWVVDTTTMEPAEARDLVLCNDSTCAVSINHDLLYGPYGMYVNGASVPLSPVDGVTASSRRSSPLAEFAHQEAVAVSEEAAARALALQRRPSLLVNRAPYSAFYDIYSIIDFGGVVVTGNSSTFLHQTGQDQLLVLRALRQRITDAVRADLGILPQIDIDAQNCSAFAEVRWWSALWSGASRSPEAPDAINPGADPDELQPLPPSFNITSLTALGMDPYTARSYLRTLWFVMHHPNAAPDVQAPSLINWYRWALGYGAHRLLRGTSAMPGSSSSPSLQVSHGGAAGGNVEAPAVPAATPTNDMILTIFLRAIALGGNSAARSAYRQSIFGSADAADGFHDLDAAGASQAAHHKGFSPGALAAVIIGPQAGVALGVAVVAALLVLHRRRAARHRDLLGRVRAPRAGPDTTLLITDVQNSTVLWEALSVATMDVALQLHNSCIRKALAEYDGYESATEGDSFIVAFASPASATAFAAACQLALLEANWPEELLQHPDGAVVLVDPRESMMAGPPPPPTSGFPGVPTGTGTAAAAAAGGAYPAPVSGGTSIALALAPRSLPPLPPPPPLAAAASSTASRPPSDTGFGRMAQPMCSRTGTSIPYIPMYPTSGAQSRRCCSSSQVQLSTAAGGTPPLRPTLHTALQQQSRGIRAVSFSGGARVCAPAPGAMVSGFGATGVITAAPPPAPMTAIAMLPSRPGPSRSSNYVPHSDTGIMTCSEVQVAPASAAAMAFATAAARAALGSGSSARGLGGGGSRRAQAAPTPPSPLPEDQAGLDTEISRLAEAVAAAGGVAKVRSRRDMVQQQEQQQRAHQQQQDSSDNEHLLVSSGLLGSFVATSNQMDESTSEAGSWCPWQELLAASFPVVPPAVAAAAMAAATAAAGKGPVFRREPNQGCLRLPDGRIVAFRGLRVRMGLHSGLDDSRHVAFNKVASSYQYSGDFAEMARLVSDSAHGGLLVLSRPAFARLRHCVEQGRGKGSSSGGGGGGGAGSCRQALRGVTLVYAGHHLLKGSVGAAAFGSAAAAGAAAVRAGGSGPCSGRCCGGSGNCSGALSSSPRTESLPPYLLPRPFARSPLGKISTGKALSPYATTYDGSVCTMAMYDVSTGGAPAPSGDGAIAPSRGKAGGGPSSATATAAAAAAGGGGTGEAAAPMLTPEPSLKARSVPIVADTAELDESDDCGAAAAARSRDVRSIRASRSLRLAPRATTLQPPPPPAAIACGMGVQVESLTHGSVLPAPQPHAALLLLPETPYPPVHQPQRPQSQRGWLERWLTPPALKLAQRQGLGSASGSGVPQPAPSHGGGVEPHHPRERGGLSSSTAYPRAHWSHRLRSLLRTGPRHDQILDGTRHGVPPTLPQPLYIAVPSGLLCRLALLPPLRSRWSSQLSSLDAPTGLITVAFLKVVGAATLMAELPPGVAAEALEQCQRLVVGLLGSRGGYLVEGCGDGLVLAAFGAPPAAVEWALDCLEGLKRLDWDPALLAHELCAEHVEALAVPAVKPSAASQQKMSMMPMPAAGAGPAVAAAPEAPSLLARTRTFAGEPVRRPVVNRGLRIKVGLAIGVATHSLNERSGRLSYRGKLMNRAARLAGIASPSQVLCSLSVWEACETADEDFTSRVSGNFLGPMQLKGIREPLNVVHCSREFREEAMRTGMGTGLGMAE